MFLRTRRGTSVAFDLWHGAPSNRSRTISRTILCFQNVTSCVRETVFRVSIRVISAEESVHSAARSIEFIYIKLSFNVKTVYFQTPEQTRFCPSSCGGIRSPRLRIGRSITMLTFAASKCSAQYNIAKRTG